MIIDWNGYRDGAVSADTAGLQVVERNGSRYAIVTHQINTAPCVYDVHPKVYAHGTEDNEVVRHEAGAYPIRWLLDAAELANLISLGD